MRWSRETWEPRAWHRVSPQCIAARCIIETVSLLEVWGQRSPFGQNLKWSSPWISSSSREGPDEWSQHDNHVSCVQASRQHLVPLWGLSWVQGKRGDLSWLRWTEDTFFHPVSKASQLSCWTGTHTMRPSRCWQPPCQHKWGCREATDEPRAREPGDTRPGLHCSRHSPDSGLPVLQELRWSGGTFLFFGAVKHPCAGRRYVWR